MQQPAPSQPATPGQPPTPSSAPPPGAPCRGSCSGGQLHRGQLQPVQLPGVDAPSSGKTSVLQPWREYGYSLQWENHTPSCGKTTVLRFSHRRDATTYNGRRKYIRSVTHFSTFCCLALYSARSKQCIFQSFCLRFRSCSLFLFSLHVWWKAYDFIHLETEQQETKGTK